MIECRTTYDHLSIYVVFNFFRYLCWRTSKSFSLSVFPKTLSRLSLTFLGTNNLKFRIVTLGKIVILPIFQKFHWNFELPVVNLESWYPFSSYTCTFEFNARKIHRIGVSVNNIESLIIPRLTRRTVVKVSPLL